MLQLRKSAVCNRIISNCTNVLCLFRYVVNENFTSELAKKASPAAEGMCKWVGSPAFPPMFGFRLACVEGWPCLKVPLVRSEARLECGLNVCASACACAFVYACDYACAVCTQLIVPVSVLCAGGCTPW